MPANIIEMPRWGGVTINKRKTKNKQTDLLTYSQEPTVCSNLKGLKVLKVAITAIDTFSLHTYGVQFLNGAHLVEDGDCTTRLEFLTSSLSAGKSSHSVRNSRRVVPGSSIIREGQSI